MYAIQNVPNVIGAALRTTTAARDNAVRVAAALEAAENELSVAYQAPWGTCALAAKRLVIAAASLTAARKAVADCVRRYRVTPRGWYGRWVGRLEGSDHVDQVAERVIRELGRFAQDIGAPVPMFSDCADALVWLDDMAALGVVERA